MLGRFSRGVRCARQRRRHPSENTESRCCVAAVAQSASSSAAAASFTHIRRGDSLPRDRSGAFMRETEPHVGLSLLETDYEIVGELEGPNDRTRVYIANAKAAEAKRRDDQPGAGTSTYPTPQGHVG